MLTVVSYLAAVAYSYLYFIALACHKAKGRQFQYLHAIVVGIGAELYDLLLILRILFLLAGVLLKLVFLPNFGVTVLLLEEKTKVSVTYFLFCLLKPQHLYVSLASWMSMWFLVLRPLWLSKVLKTLEIQSLV